MANLLKSSALLCSALCYLFAIASYAQVSTEQNYTADLRRQLPAADFVELTAQQHSFVSLQKDSMTSFTKGTAILVPDASQHPAEPKQLDMLRQELPLLGWATLAIMPPALPSSLTADSLPDYENVLAERLNTALQHAQQNAGTIIVIAQGTSGAMLNTLLVNAKLPEPAALVMLSAFLPDTTLNQQFAEMVALQQVPTLDISNRQDPIQVLSQLPKRRQFANKHLKAFYRQRLLAGSAYHAENQHWLLQEINGWLLSIGL